ncbi:hypothetical protein SAMN05444320_102641 [Streptoalloteichus hindustanus]|uniref:Uncharacterized protein n=1 Tax=Streptoalloteichus hindustanus TaxID=2017 RepID=A0A1M4Z8F0_STRHI|nr:hypothetical protein SAMN05444320_102641 [Streptoalloteichus hindustanus]
MVHELVCGILRILRRPRARGDGSACVVTAVPSTASALRARGWFRRVNTSGDPWAVGPARGDGSYGTTNATTALLSASHAWGWFLGDVGLTREVRRPRVVGVRG